MRDKDRVRRANRILIIVALLFILYGIFYRVQTGDNKFYIMGFELEMPFGGQSDDASEATGSEENTEGAAQDNADAQTAK